MVASSFPAQQIHLLCDYTTFPGALA